MTARILVVDDEPDVELLLKQVFRHFIEEQHYHFSFVNSGLEALGILKADNQLIDVLMLDINMPDIDGLTLLDYLAGSSFDGITIIVSAYGDMDNIRTAMNRGAFDFILKPIQLTDLQATLDKAIIQVRAQRESKRIKVLEELKTRFFSNITHEFRTPLTLIMTLAKDLLDRQDLTKSVHQDLMSILRNSNHLLRLINQLLDLAKLEANKMGISLQQSDLLQFLEQLINGFRAQAKQQSMLLITDLQVKGIWLFDADKLEKIILNLLSNALKFTAEGGTVTITATPFTSGSSLESLPSVGVGPSQRQGLQLTVSDTGVGLTQDQQIHLFDRFYQADPSMTRAYEGTGIGLALVKELCDLLGGEITVTSKPGQGSAFSVWLPMEPLNEELTPIQTSDVLWPLAGNAPAEMHQPAPVIQVQDLPGESEESPLILIVEDNQDLRMFLARALGKLYRVLTATNGREAWEIITHELPELIISDVMMPFMNGFELCQRVKQTPETSHIAVMLLTAKAGQDSRIDGLNAGANDYLPKPFHTDELRLRVRNLLTYQQQLRTFYQQLFRQPDSSLNQSLGTDDFMQQLYAAIDNNLDNAELTVEVLATAVSVSQRTLHRKLQALIGMNASDLIRSYRLKRAAQMLREGQSITSAAYATGFENLAYFSTRFKELYTMTPTEYIKSR